MDALVLVSNLIIFWWSKIVSRKKLSTSYIQRNINPKAAGRTKAETDKRLKTYCLQGKKNGHCLDSFPWMQWCVKCSIRGSWNVGSLLDFSSCFSTARYPSTGGVFIHFSDIFLLPFQITLVPSLKFRCSRLLPLTFFPSSKPFSFQLQAMSTIQARAIYFYLNWTRFVHDKLCENPC